MSLGTVIFLVAIGVFALILILFPETRTLFSGFVRLFIKDAASTPEGAEAIYQEKIKEVQDAYNRADDALRKTSGRLSIETDKLKKLNEKLIQCESACESLVKAGKDDMAVLKNEERKEIKADIARTEELINAYTKAKSDAQEVFTMCESNLKKLKRESRDVVENMKTKKALDEAYNEIDELKNSTAVDKLLEDIKIKNEDLNAQVEGARTIHESKLSTKIAKADKAAADAQGDEYLEELKKKFRG